MFKDNKYTKWYYSIIKNAKQIEGEWHHIIPKSLGGNNMIENLVLLSLRQHYICHILLTKMCINNQHHCKMVWALHRMTFSDNYSLNSHYYEYCRKIHKENLTLNHPANLNSEWFSEEMSRRSLLGYKNNPNLKLIRAKALNERLANTEFRDIWNAHAKQMANIGGQAARKKLKGIKRPEMSKPGNMNASALLYKIKEPNGNIVEITTEYLMQYLGDKPLSISSFKKNGKSKGFEIISKHSLRERRVGNV